jgi:hypothetical protein
MTFTETIRSWASRLQSAALAARERNALRTELADLAARGELDRALADAGLTRAQVPTLVRSHPNACHLLARMMDELGIDAESVDEADSMHDAAWRCTTCTQKRICAAWLEHPRDETWRAFCPNADTFEEARRLGAAGQS